jgi:hypothetical protein
VETVASRHETATPAEPVVWLSGAFVTAVNKIGPIFWVAGAALAYADLFLKTGHLSFGGSLSPFLVVFFAGTIFMVWLCFRVQKVGYAGRELVVSNYLRTERIPFDSIEAVEPVWWNYRRMVRIRFRSNTSFGQVVYYIPKWAAFKCMWVAPEKELRELLEGTSRYRSFEYPSE